MSDEKYSEDDSERTLITLDQLSQTIEVMNSVVNRLRQHLNEQLQAQPKLTAETEQTASNSVSEQLAQPPVATAEKEGFVIEIAQSEITPNGKFNRIIH